MRPSEQSVISAAMPHELRVGGPATKAQKGSGAWIEWLMLVGYAAATAIAIGCALGIGVALTASAIMGGADETASYNAPAAVSTASPSHDTPVRLTPASLPATR